MGAEAGGGTRLLERPAVDADEADVAVPLLRLDVRRELAVSRDVGLERRERAVRLRVPAHEGVLVDVPDVLVPEVVEEEVVEVEVVEEVMVKAVAEAAGCLYRSHVVMYLTIRGRISRIPVITCTNTFSTSSSFEIFS